MDSNLDGRNMNKMDFITYGHKMNTNEGIGLDWMKVFGVEFSKYLFFKGHLVFIYY